MAIQISGSKQFVILNGMKDLVFQMEFVLNRKTGSFVPLTWLDRPSDPLRMTN
jgi:hypothetical protein